MALRIDLVGVEGVRTELSVLTAAEAPLFTTKSNEGDMNGMARNEDDEVHITLKQCNRRSKRHAKVLYRPF